jgi:hypothetical protein
MPRRGTEADAGMGRGGWQCQVEAERGQVDASTWMRRVAWRWAHACVGRRQLPTRGEGQTQVKASRPLVGFGD